MQRRGQVPAARAASDAPPGQRPQLQSSCNSRSLGLYHSAPQTGREGGQQKRSCGMWHTLGRGPSFSLPGVGAPGGGGGSFFRVLLAVSSSTSP